MYHNWLKNQDFCQFYEQSVPSTFSAPQWARYLNRELCAESMEKFIEYHMKEQRKMSQVLVGIYLKGSHSSQYENPCADPQGMLRPAIALPYNFRMYMFLKWMIPLKICIKNHQFEWYFSFLDCILGWRRKQT